MSKILSLSYPISLLKELIAIPSISSLNPQIDQSNRPIIDRLAEWLADLGFKTEILPLPNNPRKANLIATFGRGSDGLVLAGHTDTVPYDKSGWQSDPFTLTERNNRYYGLGTADMKGFFALAISAIQPLLDQAFKQPLILVATADEESSMSGARALVQQNYPKAKFAIIGEPTGLQPIYMHKGIMLPSIHIIGKSGHSSMPALGRNALEAMQAFMARLLQYRGDLQQRFQEPAFAVATPTLNLGCIHGGDNPNRICGDCHLAFDVRLLPGMDPLEIRNAIESELQTVAQEFGVTAHWEEPFAAVPPFAVEKSAALVQMVEQMTQQEAKAVNFTTEAPFFQQLGMTPVVLGPGHIDQAHQPNEFLAVDQIEPTIVLIRDLVQKICLRENA